MFYANYGLLKHDKQSRRIEEAQAVMQRIGMQLIQEKKAAISRERAEKSEQEKPFDGVERRDLRSRDLLTLLLKANMATDIPESQRLSDEDVLARAYPKPRRPSYRPANSLK